MKLSAALLVLATVAFASSSMCYAADNSVKSGWADLKKLANDVSVQSSSFHIEPAFSTTAPHSFDYTSQQIERIEQLTRHQDPEPAPLVRFGFKSSGSSDASKITQRMLQSLITDGTIGVTYTW